MSRTLAKMAEDDVRNAYKRWAPIYDATFGKIVEAGIKQTVLRANEFKGRVLRVYIRNAGRTEDKARFEGQVLFDEPKEAALDAVEHSLASKACVDKAFP